MPSESIEISTLASSAAVKFETVGATVKGRIVGVAQAQQTDIDTGAPLVWNDGTPRMQLVIRLEVEGETKTLYAKGGTFEVATGEGTSMQQAIVDAVMGAGASRIETGATLEVAHSGIGKKTSAAKSAPKLYRARYSPPVEAVPIAGLFSDEPF